MGHVGLFHSLYLIRGELDGKGRHGVLRVMRLGGTKDWGSYLLMAHDAMRHIRFFQVGDLFLSQFH